MAIARRENTQPRPIRSHDEIRLVGVVLSRNHMAQRYETGVTSRCLIGEQGCRVVSGRYGRQRLINNRTSNIGLRMGYLLRIELLG